MGNISNSIITKLNQIRYGITEKPKLEILRFLYEKNYKANNTNPLISVYVPTYNRAKILLDKAVPSVLKQTYNNFEFLIIGDRCTDETTELVSKINDDRVKYTNIQYKKKPFPENDIKNFWLAGEVVAANYALSIAKGKWIARINDHEVWNNDYLERLLAFAEFGNYEWVSAQVEEKRFGKKFVESGSKAYSEYLETEKLLKKNKNNPEIGSLSTWLYRSYLNHFPFNIHCWRKRINSVCDLDLAVRFVKAGVRLGHLEEVVLKRYPRPGEESVGWEAHKLDKKNKEEYYFNQ